jgi:hypothetical protein
MKTRLSLAAVLAATAFAGAAGADTTLMSVNFENFTAGQLTDDASGATAGQGGWYTFTSGTGGAANFNIVNDPQAGGSRGQSLAITAGNTNSGNNVTRFAWTNDVAANIGTRGPGENLIVATYDFYMGGASATNTNRYGGYLYDVTGSKILAGVTMQNNTGQLFLVANYNNAGAIGNFAFNLGTGAVLSRNTWYRFAVTFDITTGRAQAGYSTDGGANYNLWFVDGAAAGTLVDEFDLIGSANSGTAAQGQTIGYYDNINVIATPAPGALALLAVAGLMGSRRRRS